MMVILPELLKKLILYKAGVRRKRYKERLRRKGYNPENPKDLVQMDSITTFLDGMKRYIITGIDIVTRFGFALAYKSLSSRNVRDFMEKFMQVVPFKIRDGAGR